MGGLVHLCWLLVWLGEEGLGEQGQVRQKARKGPDHDDVLHDLWENLDFNLRALEDFKHGNDLIGIVFCITCGGRGQMRGGYDWSNFSTSEVLTF